MCIRDSNKPYDMYEVIGAIVDGGEFLEIQKDYAKNIIIGFARFNGCLLYTSFTIDSSLTSRRHHPSTIFHELSGLAPLHLSLIHI